MIGIIGGILAVAFAAGIAAVYLSYANLDHRFPDKRIGFWSLIFNSTVLGFFVVMSMGALAQNETELASNLAMMVLGLLATSAIAPPYYVDEITHPELMERWMEGIKSRLSALFVVKVAALVIAFITAIYFTWYWVLGFICCIALMVKSGALMFSDAHVQGYSSGFIPQQIMKKWMFRSGASLIAFALLWVASPYFIFTQTGVEPSSWYGYAGVGLGFLVTGFRD